MTELRVETKGEQDAFWVATLAGPPGNIIDMEAITALRELAAKAKAEPKLKAILFVGEGKHFSFGASVEDHLPGAVDTFLPAFGAIFRDLADAAVPCAAAVRGQCLGGGFELAAWCHFLFADSTARFGVPEIKLGVFPPPAAILLPFLVGQRRADDWILSGRVFPASDLSAKGLCTAVTLDEGDVEQDALAWLTKHLTGSSAFSLRHATRAARAGLDQALGTALPAVEEQYLKELMAGADPLEGLTAFTQRRKAEWSNA